MIRAEFFGIKAWIDADDVWQCEDRRLLSILRAMYSVTSDGYSYDPDPAFTAARKATEALGGRITYAPPSDAVEGVVY